MGILLLTAFSLFSCGDRYTPDVSGIRIDLPVKRFEQDFFAIDTTRLAASLQQLHQQYPGFLADFTQNILGLPPTGDSAQVLELVRQFIRDYRPVKDSADKVFRNFEPHAKAVRQGLQFVKYYFPAYKLPGQLITFVGPMDAYYAATIGGYGDVITHDGLAVGLQLHLGSEFSMYHSEMGQSLYPGYISRRFTPDYIAVNCMKNVIDDLFPEKGIEKPLVEQMVEKGKRVYLLEKFLPYTPDSLRMGYTSKQLQACYKNEGRIWNFFLVNSLLLNTDYGVIKEYVNDAPNTPTISEQAPGFIGLFVGRQIVKKFLEKHPDMGLPELMNTDPRKIFEESKYKPG